MFWRMYEQTLTDLCNRKQMYVFLLVSQSKNSNYHVLMRATRFSILISNLMLSIPVLLQNNIFNSENAMEKPIDLNNELNKLKRGYEHQLAKKIGLIASNWELLYRQWQPVLLDELISNVHKLTGSSGTFGFSAISSISRELECALNSLVGNQKPDVITNNFVIGRIKRLLEMSNYIDSSTCLGQLEHDYFSEKIVRTTPSLLTVQDVLVYWLGIDLASPDSSIKLLIDYGINTNFYQKTECLLKAIEQTRPNLVVLDLAAPDVSNENIFILAGQIVAMGIRVFIATKQNNFDCRLKTVRAGAHAYIVKPIDIYSLISKIKNILIVDNENPPKILVVDDQIAVAEFYAAILNKFGMNVFVESDPRKTLHLIGEYAPDLILLDLNMPGVSGLELATIIRQHDQYQSIPIVFLSGNENQEKKTSLIEVGSDDFICKGISPYDFVVQIKSRVERARIISSKMYQDSLTGLLNHAQIRLSMEKFFKQCSRKTVPLSVAIIDIDFFKKVNDTHGHLIGDKVIKSLSQLLERRLRATDCIGRSGGEEFMLVIPDCDAGSAKVIVDSLRNDFSKIIFSAGDSSFKVSFSAGIADSQDMTSATEQIRLADTALYKAKMSGRNRVCAH